MEKKKGNQFSLTEAAQHDQQKNLKALVTGWGAVSKRRQGPDSKTQRRKAGRKS